MRFVEDLTQTEIAARVGVSQMQVSRSCVARLIGCERLRMPPPDVLAASASQGRFTASDNPFTATDRAHDGERLPAPVGQTGSPNIRLSLSNRPENVALVRQMLAGVAEAVGLDGNDLNDISTAATEACNNVVLHAYEGGKDRLRSTSMQAPRRSKSWCVTAAAGSARRLEAPRRLPGSGSP